jgi:hypothetical protein
MGRAESGERSAESGEIIFGHDSRSGRSIMKKETGSI